MLFDSIVASVLPQHNPFAQVTEADKLPLQVAFAVLGR
jgi:hypothetical protein